MKADSRGQLHCSTQHAWQQISRLRTEIKIFNFNLTVVSLIPAKINNHFLCHLRHLACISLHVHVCVCITACVCVCVCVCMCITACVCVCMCVCALEINGDLNQGLHQHA